LLDLFVAGKIKFVVPVPHILWGNRVGPRGYRYRYKDAGKFYNFLLYMALAQLKTALILCIKMSCGTVRFRTYQVVLYTCISE
jgi:uncharacterized membrane protein